MGTSVSAFGRAAGPAVMGAAFSHGIRRGYVIFPWWLLALFCVISAVPVFWIVETDGLSRDDEVESGVEFEDEGWETDSGNESDYGVVAGRR